MFPPDAMLPRTTSRSTFALLCAMVVLAMGCPSKHPEHPSSSAPDAQAPRPSVSARGFRVSDADVDAREAPKLAPTTPMNEAETSALLGRLPAMPPSDDAPFAMRPKSLPAPRPGTTVEGVFPPPATSAVKPTTADSAPLRVIRKQPEGDVALAPYVTVTFSEPMAPITSQEELAKVPVPVTLAPQPKGEWRWLGTQTVMFQPVETPDVSPARMPMATDFSVSVAPDAKSVSGKLVPPTRWTFSTPAPKLVQHLPSGGATKLTPLIFVEFDQAIEEASLLSSITLSQDRGSPVRVRRAEALEIADDAALASTVAKAKRGRFVVLKPEQALSPATSYTVTVAKGLRSAEGPKTTGEALSFSFRTYDAFKISRHRCPSKECRPRQPFYVELNNPIDPEAFDPKLVNVEPPIPHMKVEASYSSIQISGRTKGRTKYTVTLPASLKDTFGQTLGKDQRVTFETVSAEPALMAEPSTVTVVDPNGKPTALVHSVNERNLSVKVYAVEPSDFEKYRAWREAWDMDRQEGPPPGRLVVDRKLTPEGDPDDLVESRIDLSPALKSGLGHALVIVESTRPRRHPRAPEWMRVWAQVTKIGLDATLDPDGALVWATELLSGKPLESVDVTLDGSSAKTDREGLARLAAHSGGMIVARQGGDTAILAPDGHYRSEFHFPPRAGRTERFFVFDDRGMYKPGEKVTLKGWVRGFEATKTGDLEYSRYAGRTFAYAVKDARYADITKGTLSVDERGEFDVAFTLPTSANLGHATVIVTPEAPEQGPSQNIHAFQIQEFRTPEYEVSTSVSEGPFFAGTHAIVTAKASYYAGGALPNAETTWTLTRSVGHFTPPNRSDYVFGNHEANVYRFGHFGRAESDAEKSVTWSGRTDAQGTHRIRLDFDATEPPYPMSLTAAGTVTDVNRQEWSSTASLLVHPAKVTAGLKLGRGFVRAGEKLPVEVIVSDLEGALVAGRRVLVQIARIDRSAKKGEELLDVATCELTSSSSPSRCELGTKQGGLHRITALVEDAEGRRSQTTLSAWVLGDSPRERGVETEALQLVSDKKEYKAGETAEILVVAPFAPAEGLLTVRRGGVIDAIRFTMSTPLSSVRVPIKDRNFPTLHVRALVVGAKARENDAGELDPSLPKQPAQATAGLSLSVPPADRKLEVLAVPREKAVSPGGSTTVEITLREPNGKPVVDGTAAVVVVDEAVLALSGHATPNPLSAFYTDIGEQAFDVGIRSQIKLASDANLIASGARDGFLEGASGLAAPSAHAPMMRMKAMAAMEAAPGEGGGAAPKPIALRTNFTPLAVFVPSGRSNARGKLDVPVTLPDNLTRYRIMVVASAGERLFGSAESSLTARLPLMARPSAPRFLNIGDTFELPVVLQNQTDNAIDASVVVRAANGGVEKLGKKVRVPARDRVEVRFAANAEKPGKATFQIGVSGANHADAAMVTLPVWTPATTEAFATYGVIDQGAVGQTIKKPEGIVSSIGGLEITSSSTALQGLTDAVLYLVRYPFDCNEQVASRLLAVASLKDVLSAFQAEGMPPPSELLRTVTADIEHLKRRQDGSGGWGFWFDNPWPYLSIHTTHALVRAKEKGFSVPAETLTRANAYLRAIESHIPAYYSEEARRALVAYALYTRFQMNDADPRKAVKLVQDAGGPEKLGLEALGWLLPTLASDKGRDAKALVAEIQRHLENRMTEQAGAAHFTSDYGEGNYLLLHSNRRVDGVLLEALIATDPQNAIIPKLVTGLLGHRKAGRWSSTQENAFVLLALDRYFAKYENVTPSFVARAWLGDQLAAEGEFRGRSTDRSFTRVPMAALPKGTSALVIGKEGAGRLYYRVGMQYVPDDLRPKPIDRGFVVQRVYEPVERPEDVRRDAEGTWHVKAGAKVRTRVTMVAPARRYHVALVDPLPAGFEAMNAALRVTGPIPQDPKAQPSGDGWWMRTWYEHDNLRDERAEAFASLLWEGVHEYVYTSRATTPGAFFVPPPKAEEMYSPEVFGRGAGDRVIVE